MIKLKIIEVKQEKLAEAIDFTISNLKDFFSKNKLLQVELIIEELFVNVLMHGSTNLTNTTFSIGINQVKDNEIELTIKDNGIAFNILEKTSPDLDLDIDKRPIGGLGIFSNKRIFR